MKTKITKSKYFIFWLIVWLSLLWTWVYATVTEAWTLWSLFEKVGSSYKLLWDNIKDNTIDSSEIENETLKSEDIKNWEVKNEDLADNSVDNRVLKNTENFTVKKINSDDWYQVDWRTMISYNWYSHTAQATSNDHYWFFEIKRNDWRRWAYFWRGNWWDTVDLHLDNANKLNISWGNLYVNWKPILTFIHWNCNASNVWKLKSENGIIYICKHYNEVTYTNPVKNWRNLHDATGTAERYCLEHWLPYSWRIRSSRHGSRKMAIWWDTYWWHTYHSKHYHIYKLYCWWYQWEKYNS